jgi:hypothetical protein
MGTPPNPIQVEIVELRNSFLIAGRLKYAGQYKTYAHN